MHCVFACTSTWYCGAGVPGTSYTSHSCTPGAPLPSSVPLAVSSARSFVVVTALNVTVFHSVAEVPYAVGCSTSAQAPAAVQYCSFHPLGGATPAPDSS